MPTPEAFFDAATSTLTYIVFDGSSCDGVVIDPVLGYDPATGATSNAPLAPVIAAVAKHGVKVRMILETHAHADHLSGAQELKALWPDAVLAVGDGIVSVQKTFAPRYPALPSSFATDGSQFDRLLHDGETVRAGTLSFEVRMTPGHTSACACYVFDGHVFTGDALFMPDSGTGRCDFPGGDARRLFKSITERLYTLPDATLAHPGHDYQPNGRAVAYSATIGEHRAKNIHVTAKTPEQEFVAFRTMRDATLSAPKLLHPSVQVNIDAGRLRYLGKP